MQSLLELGKKYGTDKVDHEYLPHYDQRFQARRGNPLTVLEIGAGLGASLRMWREYFPQGLIYCVDVDPKRIFEEDRIKVFQGRQSNQAFLETVCTEIGNLDIVIDDGSHCGRDHVASFEVLWPYLNDGGWYCIEDCQSLYADRDGVYCWTQPGDHTIIAEITGRWRDIIRGQDTIREVVVIGRWISSGLIMLRKDKVRPEA